MDTFDTLLQRYLKLYKNFHDDKDPPHLEDAKEFFDRIKHIRDNTISCISFTEASCNIIFSNKNVSCTVYYDYDYKSDALYIVKGNKEYNSSYLDLDDTFSDNLDKLLLSCGI